MKIYLSISSIFISVCFIFPIYSYGQNNSPISEKQKIEGYNLQERCGQQSEEFFYKKYGKKFESFEGGFMTSVYRNHYNKKMNKCFILSVYELKSHKDGLFYSQHILTDIHENTIYGELRVDNDKTECYVLKTKCKSNEEWFILIHPYMND